MLNSFVILYRHIYSHDDVLFVEDRAELCAGYVTELSVRHGGHVTRIADMIDDAAR